MVFFFCQILKCEGGLCLFQQSYNPNEDHAEAEMELCARLEAFLDAAKAFNVIYAKVGLLSLSSVFLSQCRISFM
jgi:hypothetical protein